MLSIRELEILKAALEGDVQRQKYQLNEIGSDIRFEIWLHETEMLLRKVSIRLSKELATDVGVEYLKCN